MYLEYKDFNSKKSICLFCSEGDANGIGEWLKKYSFNNLKLEALQWVVKTGESNSENILESFEILANFIV